MVSKWRTVVLASLIALSGLSARGLVSAHMPVSVEPTRVVFGHETIEYLPRDPNALAITDGQTYIPPSDSLWTSIEVQSGGVLKFDRTRNTVLRFQTLVIFPGGRLDVGTAADPIPCGITATLIVRNVPIAAQDVFEWGNGIINFGSQSRVGCAKTAWSEMQDAPPGAMSLSVDDVSGWHVGDELLIPDMAQPARNFQSRRERPVVIASISGTAVSLSKPLDFEHRSVRRPDGSVVLRPRVANLTRNIIVRSDAPTGGTRGHEANIGESASWDIRYNQSIGMGRTQATPVNNSDGVRHGSNQIGKYAGHDHHANGHGSKRIGNSYLGHFGSKWAIAVHRTHDTLVEDNVCVDFQGGCYATEDGPELRNVFRNNAAAYTIGNQREEHKNNEEGCIGCNAAFWFQGVQGSTFESNEAWANFGVSFAFFNSGHRGIGSLVPSQPGGPADTPFTAAGSIPARIRGNVDVGHVDGLSTWGGTMHIEDPVSAYASFRTVYPAIGSTATFSNLTIVCDRSAGKAIGFGSSSGYVPTTEIDGGEIRGCEVGMSGIARDRALIRDVVLQNETNIELHDQMTYVRFERVRTEPLPGVPQRDIVMQGSAPAVPGQPFPYHASEEWARNTGYLHDGSPFTVIDWQGVVGDSFRLLTPAQEGSLPARPSDATYPYAVPFSGLTSLQAWTQLGMAYRGDVFSAGECQARAGFVNAVACPGVPRPLGPPLAILTFPTMRAPAEIVGGQYVNGFVVLTGTPQFASAQQEGVQMTIGGSVVAPSSAAFEGVRRFKMPAVSPGTHHAQLCRTNAAGVIASSCRVFEYRVGDGTAPPPPPVETCNPDGTGNGVDEDGDGLIDEGCIVLPLPPPIGCTTITTEGPTLTAPDGFEWRLVFGVEDRPDWATVYRNNVNVRETDWNPAVRLGTDGQIYVANYYGTRWERWVRYTGSGWIEATPSCSGAQFLEDLIGHDFFVAWVRPHQQIDHQLHLLGLDLFRREPLQRFREAARAHRPRLGNRPAVVVEVQKPADVQDPIGQERREAIHGPRVGAIEEDVIEPRAVPEHLDQRPVVAIEQLGRVRVAHDVGQSLRCRQLQNLGHAVIEVEDMQRAAALAEHLGERDRRVPQVGAKLRDRRTSGGLEKLQRGRVRAGDADRIGVGAIGPELLHEGFDALAHGLGSLSR